MSTVRRALTMIAGLGIIIALGAGPAQASNPYSPTTECNKDHGGGFSVIDHATLAAQSASGTVYLLANARWMCVITMKNGNLGIPTPTSARVQTYPKGNLITDGDTVKYSYFAGPVYVFAPSVCIQWGGMVADNSELGSHQDSYLSPWEHGTCTREIAVADLALEQFYNTSHNHASPAGTLCNYFTGWRTTSVTKCSNGWYAENWCADFVYYTYYKSRMIDIGGINGLADSLRTYGGTYHTRGSSYSPKPGDAILFDFDNNGSIHHVGIVYRFDGTTITTIEGNAGTESEVHKNTYSRNNIDISGFTTPDWTWTD